MKKTLAISLFSLVCLGNLHSQNPHELKLNIAKSVFAFPEVSYEYVLNKNMSLGTTLGFGIKPQNYMGYKFAISPYSMVFCGIKNFGPKC